MTLKIGSLQTTTDKIMTSSGVHADHSDIRSTITQQILNQIH